MLPASPGVCSQRQGEAAAGAEPERLVWGSPHSLSWDVGFTLQSRCGALPAVLRFLCGRFEDLAAVYPLGKPQPSIFP